MGKRFGWTATVRNHRTGETGHASGETSGQPGYSRRQAEADVREFVREQGRKKGQVVSATDVELYG